MLTENSEVQDFLINESVYVDEGTVEMQINHPTPLNIIKSELKDEEPFHFVNCGYTISRNYDEVLDTNIIGICNSQNSQDSVKLEANLLKQNNVPFISNATNKLAISNSAYTDSPILYAYCSKPAYLNSEFINRVQSYTDRKQFNLNGILEKAPVSDNKVGIGGRNECRYKCSYCDKTFKTVSSQRRHLNVHTRPYSCIYCSKRFSQKSSLVYHVQSHTGTKQFKCHHCEKYFCRKTILDVHLRIHTGERPFECRHCGKNYNTISYLNTHLKIHSSVRPYECAYCGKRFSKKDHLICHIQVHTGVKPYRCDYCDQYFARKTTLDSHIRTHTGERPYQCPECDKTYKNQSSCVTHMRIHKSIKPYECSYCDKQFYQKSHLTVHIRRHMNHFASDSSNKRSTIRKHDSNKCTGPVENAASN